MDFDFPLEIVVRDIPRTDGLEQRIREKVAKLVVLHPRITSFRVTIESPAHHRHQKGSPYRVRLEIGIPGPEIVVTRESEVDHEHEDLKVALRDAFDAARRQINDRLERQRDLAKGARAPEAPAPGGLEEV
jgi:ribosome-associated translation inhibitor RaiA